MVVPGVRTLDLSSPAGLDKSGVQTPGTTRKRFWANRIRGLVAQWTTMFVSEIFLMYLKCPKLRVHPAPSVHISTAGCTILAGVHSVCASFFRHLLLLYYIGKVHGAISGCTVLWEP